MPNAKSKSKAKDKTKIKQNGSLKELENVKNHANTFISLVDFQKQQTQSKIYNNQTQKVKVKAVRQTKSLNQSQNPNKITLKTKCKG